ncbi:MAG: aminoacetone oxidase family FAD-binding enzyme [Fimbriimonadaceae bacterium]|nr:MAG: aminoacetone oxidase family FAD-binding enzyme [Fimbriimonadaceae bacterium]
MSRPIIVIGAGAAGIIAAWKAASEGATVLLIEKTDRIGTKILISGGGKCNITHAGSINHVLSAFRKNEANFIRPSCYRFTNEDIIDMLTDRGLRVYTRDDGRIFPVDQTAKDVVAILQAYLREANVHIKYNSPVEDIVAPGGRIQGVKVGGEMIPTDKVILCAGGSSYPKSGTTGDGYVWAKNLGHTIVPITAALAPVELLVKGERMKAGLALRNIILKAKLNGKEIARWQNDLLFTHRGVSGPTVLGITREIAERWQEGRHTLEVDFFPKQNFDQLLESANKFKSSNPNRLFRHFLDHEIPSAIVPVLLDSVDISLDTKNQYVSKKQINLLVQTLKGWEIGEVIEVLFDKGEVVAGGISLDEVDPQTMRSKVVKGLYLAGEVLDIAGPVGGYNLQAAWSTGFVAGETAAHD